MLVYLNIVLSIVLHNYYVSVSHINFAADEATLQISVKVFTDDLEAAVLDYSGVQLHLIDELPHAKADSLIFNYIMHCNSYYLNDRLEPETVQYIGYELDSEALWCYLQIDSVVALKSIKVQSKLLLDVFESQSNLIFVKAFDSEKGMHLYGDKKQETIRF